VDKFLISHIRSLAGTMKILNADTSDKTDKFLNDNVYCTKEMNSNKNEVYMSQHDEVQNEDDNMDISMIIHNLPNKECDKHVICSTQTSFHHLNEIETWKGKKDKTLKRGKYLAVYPDIDNIHNRPHLTSKIPLLQNGNMLRPQGTTGQYVMIINTCAFDSIVQFLLIGYRDWFTYYDYINNISNYNM